MSSYGRGQGPCSSQMDTHVAYTVRVLKAKTTTAQTVAVIRVIAAMERPVAVEPMLDFGK